MKELKRFTAEELNLANSIDIVEYAKQKGHVVERFGQTYRIKGYGGLVIDETRTKFNWFSESVGGGPIQFVMKTEGKDWVNAVKTLIGQDNIQSQFREFEKNEPIKKEFKLPEKNNTYKHMFAYLIKTRGIDKDIVKDFVEKHKIYENNHNSCVFVCHDENDKPVAANIRATGGTFKGDVASSNKKYPFTAEGKTKKLHVFESSIDLMSYMTLIKQGKVEGSLEDHFISTGSANNISAVEYYLKRHDIKEINVGYDNDEAGHKGYLKIFKNFPEKKVNYIVPMNKDWNRDLVTNQTKELKEFKLPQKSISSNRNTLEFLKINNIDESVSKVLIEKNLIYESIHSNIVFVGKDENEIPVAAKIYSRNTEGIKLSQYVDGSDKTNSFSLGDIKSQNIKVFKSPMEILAYKTLMLINGVDSSQLLTDIENLERIVEKQKVNKITFCFKPDDNEIDYSKYKNIDIRKHVSETDRGLFQETLYHVTEELHQEIAMG